MEATQNYPCGSMVRLSGGSMVRRSNGSIILPNDSWTTLFFGGFPAVFRGDIHTGLIVIIANLFSFGFAGFIWAFVYNKRYTLGLIEKGYELAGSDAENERARQSLGIKAR